MKLIKIALFALFALTIASPQGFAQTEDIVSYYLPFTKEGNSTEMMATAAPGAATRGLDTPYEQVVSDYMVNEQFYAEGKCLYMRSGGDNNEAFQLITVDDEYAEQIKTGVVETVSDVLRNFGQNEDGTDNRPGNAEYTHPNLVDHRPMQSAVQHQGRRNSCGVFSLLGGVEALGQGVPYDLSEQDGFYLASAHIGRNPSLDEGVWPHEMAEALQKNMVCREVDWPYQKEKENLPSQRPYNAAANGVCGLFQFYYFTVDEDLRNNVKQIERLLSLGTDVSASFYVAWDNKVARNTGEITVRYDQNGQPLKSKALHAMLIVGYNSEDRYFIVKNSYGADWGKEGYCHLSYDYFSNYAFGKWVCVTRSQVALRPQMALSSPENDETNLPSLNLLGQ